MEKFVLRSRGGEHGLKIIKYLESIGGRNSCKLDGGKVNWYYFIHEDGSIDEFIYKPKEYKEIKLLSQI